jgi:hypothetical protein
MVNVECSDVAYDRVINSEVGEKILQKKQEIFEILLYKKPFVESVGEDLLEKANEIVFDTSAKISTRTKLYEGVLELQQEIPEKDYIRDIESYLLRYPSFLGLLVLGDDLLDFERYGFPSVKSLEESITAFCVGEKEISRYHVRDFYWRLNGKKNLIASNEHGDFYANQRNVSGENGVDHTLFGDAEFFEVFVDDDSSKGISAYQDWSMFLVSLLKYAKYSNLANIYEISNWRDVLNEVGAVGTNTAEAMFGMDYFDSFIYSRSLLVKGEKSKGIPHFVGQSFYPCMEEDKLVFVREPREDEKPDFELDLDDRLGKCNGFVKCVEYSPEDLPHALKATYRLFARDRTVLPKIMEAFYSDFDKF